MAVEIKIGHHRSLALAERHLRELGEGWSIISRRRDDGAFSNRGHTFVFQKEEKKPPPPPGKVWEWIVSVTYDKSGRSFDVITTARDETEAVDVAKEFIRDDPDAQRIARAKFRGWTLVPARGARTDQEPGEAEYRGKSKAR